MDIINSIEKLLPTYTTKLPFSHKEVFFTPFRVKDAKNISIILQEDNKKLAFNAMVDLLKNNTKEINILDLCMADAEFLFLQIRSKSVDEQLNLIYNNEKVQVFIPDIKTRNQELTETITVGDNINLILETPTVKDLIKLSNFEKDSLIKSSIKKITVGNEIYHVQKFIPEELNKLIENLPIHILPKIEKFFINQPELYVVLETKDGPKEVSGILNFFIYR